VLEAVVRTSAIAGPDDPVNKGPGNSEVDGSSADGGISLFSKRIWMGDDRRPVNDTSKPAVASSCEWKHEATFPPKPKQNMGIRAELRRSSAAFTEGDGAYKLD
jgi:hypothetical protein